MPFDRTLMTEEHDLFRSSFGAFVDKAIAPYHAQWEKDGCVPREVWLQAGELGFLGLGIPSEFGGAGTDDFRFHAIISEELARIGASGVAFGLHNQVVAPYLVKLGTPEQQQRWLPGYAAGELIGAVAMSEPSAGSDLRGMRTTAQRQPDGSFVLNGQKTFITNGLLSDLVVVAAKSESASDRTTISLLVVERGMPGFNRGRRLEKLGMHAQDTAELFFENVRVPAENLLGEEGRGLHHLMANLPQERLSIAVTAVAAAETALNQTLDYTRSREAFGQPIGSFQHNRFLLAELATELKVARIFVDRCIELHNDGKLDPPDAAMAKWWTTELQLKVIDRCLQLHGGYGFMLEYPIAKNYIDSRAQTIYGGSTEIMKEIIGRSLGF